MELDEAAESCTIDGESPVVENFIWSMEISFLISAIACFSLSVNCVNQTMNQPMHPQYLIPSSMGHVESRVNLRGPPRKAKYSWVTDSE